VAKLGEAMTGGAVAGFTAAAIAIPASYAVWKYAMMEMGETRIGITGFLMAEEIDDLLFNADDVVAAYNRVALAQQLGSSADDPKWAEAYQRASEAFTADVGRPVEALHAVSRRWRASVLRGGIDEVYELHKRASSGVGTPEEMSAFVLDLAEKVTWILESIPELIGLESGMKEEREDEAPPVPGGGLLDMSPLP